MLRPEDRDSWIERERQRLLSPLGSRQPLTTTSEIAFGGRATRSYDHRGEKGFRTEVDDYRFRPSDACLTNNGGFPALDLLQTGVNVLRGHSGQWAALTPSPLLEIVGAYTRPGAVRVDCTLHKDGFTAEYFWGSSAHYAGTQDIVYEGAGCTKGIGGADGINRGMVPARYFGWRVSCSAASCAARNSGNQLVLVKGVQLTVRENTGPLVLPVAGNVWDQRGWVRSSWPATVGAGDPSGICALGITVNGQPIVSP